MFPILDYIIFGFNSVWTLLDRQVFSDVSLTFLDFIIIPFIIFFIFRIIYHEFNNNTFDLFERGTTEENIVWQKVADRISSKPRGARGSARYRAKMKDMLSEFKD